MSFFLLSSLPIYLYLVIFSSLGGRAKATRVVFCIMLGILGYIPIYLLSRLIPDLEYFPWSLRQTFFLDALYSREAFSHFAVTIVLFFALWRWQSRSKERSQEFHKVLSADELLCCLAGYFFAENFHDFLLLGPFPSEKVLFFEPLSRILFAQFLAVALESFQLKRNAVHMLKFLAYFLVAFILLNVVSAMAAILNGYWVMSLVLLAILVLFFLSYHQFKKPA